MLDAGWSEDAVIGANLVCGFYSMMNRLVDGLGIEADPQTLAMLGKQFHDCGYNGIGDMIRRSTQQPEEDGTWPQTADCSVARSQSRLRLRRWRLS